jgi:hypothetical protein
MELAERGAHAMSGVFDVGRLAEEREARPLQGLGGLDGVDGMVEWSVQVHHIDVRGVLLWERSDLLLWERGVLFFPPLYLGSSRFSLIYFDITFLPHFTLVTL